MVVTILNLEFIQEVDLKFETLITVLKVRLPLSNALVVTIYPLSFLCPHPLQFLLLLGCFALFWSLYYTLEVTLAHLDLRWLFCLRRGRGGYQAKRGHQGRGVEEALVEEAAEGEEWDSGVELNAVLDSEAKVPLLNGEQLIK